MGERHKVTASVQATLREYSDRFKPRFTDESWERLVSYVLLQLCEMTSKVKEQGGSLLSEVNCYLLVSDSLMWKDEMLPRFLADAFGAGPTMASRFNITRDCDSRVNITTKAADILFLVNNGTEDDDSEENSQDDKSEETAAAPEAKRVKHNTADVDDVIRSFMNDCCTESPNDKCAISIPVLFLLFSFWTSKLQNDIGYLKFAKKIRELYPNNFVSPQPKGTYGYLTGVRVWVRGGLPVFPTRTLLGTKSYAPNQRSLRARPVHPAAKFADS